ncbi:hypothetical protein ACN47E_003732 [Coniothyrium glycines]
MSDIEPKTPNKTGASGAAWSEAEKIAYLIVLCENEGKVDSKIAHAPIPVGRSIVSCKKLLVRLKEKHKEDIEKIKSGQPVAPTIEGDGTTKSEKAKATPRKRKTKAEAGEEAEGDKTGSPKKKATPRKKQVDIMKDEKSENEDMS